ncbi:hypothetical protein ACE6H2_001336 [Prunus campanulata]
MSKRDKDVPDNKKLCLSLHTIVQDYLQGDVSTQPEVQPNIDLEFIKKNIKGKVIGPFTFVCDDTPHDCSSRAEEIASYHHIVRTSFNSCDASFILLVEKNMVFHGLANVKFHENSKCIMVSGKGYDDRSTKSFQVHNVNLSPTFPTLLSSISVIHFLNAKYEGSLETSAGALERVMFSEPTYLGNGSAGGSVQRLEENCTSRGVRCAPGKGSRQNGSATSEKVLAMRAGHEGPSPEPVGYRWTAQATLAGHRVPAKGQTESVPLGTFPWLQTAASKLVRIMLTQCDLCLVL